jgi:hypothetical protein
VAVLDPVTDLHNRRYAERLAAFHMIERHADRPQPMTLGGDRNVTPHVARNITNRRSAID